MIANENNIAVGTILKHLDFGQGSRDFWYAGRQIKILSIDLQNQNQYLYEDVKTGKIDRFNAVGIDDFEIVLDQHLSDGIEEYRAIKDQIKQLESRKVELEEFFIESAIKGAAK